MSFDSAARLRPEVPKAGTTGTAVGEGEFISEAEKRAREEPSNIISNILHGGAVASNPRPQQQQLTINPAASLQQVRFAIQQKQSQILQLQSQKRPVPPKQFVFRDRDRIVVVRSTRGNLIQKTVTDKIKIESNQSRFNRGKIIGKNNQINKSIKKLQDEINLLKKREQELIKMQAQKQITKAKPIPTSDGDATKIQTGQNPQIQKEREIIRIREQTQENSIFNLINFIIPEQQQETETEQPEQKKASNTPLLAAAALFGGALIFG